MFTLWHVNERGKNNFKNKKYINESTLSQIILKFWIDIAELQENKEFLLVRRSVNIGLLRTSYSR